MTPLRDRPPAERRAAIALLAAFGLVTLAALEPFGGTAIPPAGPALRPPPPAMEGGAGAYAAGSPFDPARRAVAGIGRLPGTEEAVAPAGAPPVVLLSGILVDGGRGRAMFAGSADWQEPGSRVGDWTLEAVEPRAVRLRRGAETMVLRSDEALR